MQNSHLPRTSSDAEIPVSKLPGYVSEWLLSCEVSSHSNDTLSLRRIITRNLLWWLRQGEYSSCGTSELRAFALYLRNGHTEPGGRWGNPKQAKPLKPASIATYDRHIRTFFRFLVTDGIIAVSPMDRIKPPINREDTVQPYGPEHVDALLAAARKSLNPLRDEAILLLLLDTGARASEVCGIRWKEVDLTAHRVTVLGKGNKSRPLFFGNCTARALYKYVNRDGREPDDPLFMSQRGDPLNRNGLLQLVGRLGKVAGIDDLSCNIHRWRHTAAITALREGWPQLAVMTQLGHTQIRQTQRYVAIAEADVAGQARRSSPADGIKRRGKQK